MIKNKLSGKLMNESLASNKGFNGIKGSNHSIFKPHSCKLYLQLFIELLPEMKIDSLSKVNRLEVLRNVGTIL